VGDGPGTLVSLDRPLSSVRRACPVCGRLSHDLIYQQRFEHFPNGSVTDGYDVVSCSECGVCFASGLPNQSRIDECYNTSSKYDLGASGGLLSGQDVERFASLAEFVGVHVADRSCAVLDVGTATGGFLLALGDQGFTSLHGVDPSPEAVHVARHDHGLEVAVGGLEAALVPDKGFRLVCFVSVLEHLLDPAAVVQAAAGSLDPDGMVLVQVPDASGFADHIDAPYQQFSVEHINYFTGRSLRNLMAAQGFHVLAERSLVCNQSGDTLAPGIEALFRRSGNAASPAEIDTAGPRALREYVARCARKEQTVCGILTELAESQQPLYVWGAGTHTLHLLQSSPLAACNITAFIDSNPHYAGATLAGRIVLAPADLTPDAPILVSSAGRQSEIAAAARQLYGNGVRLILLYRQ
jgi:2-polyprenyl-3-methyl-5-hydroxy-6-metoxy-1,4-benzoquinol methylase